MINHIDSEQEELEYEYGASFGDPRHCKRHPHVKTSSNDGMHDGLCGECEYLMESDYENEDV